MRYKMKAYNKKTFNDLCIQDKIIEETKIVKLNDSLVHKYQALKVIESLVKDQLNDLKQEILEDTKQHKFFDITFLKLKVNIFLEKHIPKHLLKLRNSINND